MTEFVKRSEIDVEKGGDRPGPNLWAWIGRFVVFVGAVSYFVFFARFPSLRDFPWLNLPLVVLGLLMSALGLRRAWLDSRRKVRAKVFGSIAFCVSLSIAVLFGVYIFFLSYQLPETGGVVQVAQVAPDFALPDQHGRTVRLSDFRGKPIVVDFYRGHW